jgi:putative transposase
MKQELEQNDNLRLSGGFRFYERNLPHFEQPGGYYFITFNAVKLIELSGEAKNIVFNSIKFHSDKKYILYFFVVMGTHVHIVMQPKEETNEKLYSLAQITHSIKSYSAHQIRKLMQNEGSIWQDENYDRVVRDEADYLEKMNYIIYNPMKAGLVEEPQKYKWLFVKEE